MGVIASGEEKEDRSVGWYQSSSGAYCLHFQDWSNFVASDEGSTFCRNVSADSSDTLIVIDTLQGQALQISAPYKNLHDRLICSPLS